MMDIYLWFLITLDIVSGEFFSKYQKSKVLIENVYCKNNDFYNLVDKFSVNTIVACGLKCSANDDCRRFMFHKVTKMCLLFESGEFCYTEENIDGKVCFIQRYVCNNNGNCVRCPIGFYGNTCQHIIQDCAHGYQLGVAPEKHLLSYIQPNKMEEILLVKCMFKWGGYTFIQVRDGNCREVSFNRTLTEYANGFGSVYGEHWLGLKHVYNILQNHPNFKLNVMVTLSNSQTYQAHYNIFSISSPNTGFLLSAGGFFEDPSSPLGDSLTDGSYNLNGRPFSTFDQDHSNNNCPKRFQGGWWYLADHVCSRGNVNGIRFNANADSSLHWTDNMGVNTDVYIVNLRILRG